MGKWLRSRCWTRLSSNTDVINLNRENVHMSDNAIPTVFFLGYILPLAEWLQRKSYRYVLVWSLDAMCVIPEEDGSFVHSRTTQVTLLISGPKCIFFCSFHLPNKDEDVYSLSGVLGGSESGGRISITLRLLWQGKNGLEREGNKERVRLPEE